MAWNAETHRDKRERGLAGNDRRGSALVKVLLGSALGVLAVAIFMAVSPM